MFVATMIINIRNNNEWKILGQEEISDPVIRIGRSPSNDIRLDYRYVSRKHATLFKHADLPDYEIMDGTIISTASKVEIVPSRCGIEINGIKLEQGERKILRNNDLITIVPNKITLSYIRPDINEISDIEITYVPPELLEDDE